MAINRTIVVIASFGTLLISFFAVSSVNAQKPADPFSGSKKQACLGATLGTSDPCDDTATTKVDSLIQTVVNILTVIIGIAAVIMIMISGLRFITSGGDSNGITAARNGVIYAVVGLILVALAQVIVRFVLNRTA